MAVLADTGVHGRLFAFGCFILYLCIMLLAPVHSWDYPIEAHW